MDNIKQQAGQLEYNTDNLSHDMENTVDKVEALVIGISVYPSRTS